MNTNIWNSPQMGGAGGALKALAKNLANQLNLNRSEMKRVVARVISECHGKGNVGDYNGHMFYVKPQRIDITEQIIQSKEAFDEMLHQKGLRSKRPVERSPSCSRSLTYKLTVGDKAEKSLTGVIIDQNHLRNRSHPTDIVVEMSKCLGQSRSKAALKRGPSGGSKKLPKRNPAAARSAMLIEQKSVGKAKQQKKNRLARLGKPKNIVRAPINPLKSCEIPIAKLVQQQEQQLQQPQQPQQPQQSQHAHYAQQSQQPQRQPSRAILRPTRLRQSAGEMNGQSILSMKQHVSNKLKIVPSHMRAKPEKLFGLKKTKSIKLTAPKPHTVVGRNVFEDKVKKRSGRLAAGSIFSGAHRRTILPPKKGDNSLWRSTYKFHGNAGLAYRPAPINNNNNSNNNYNRRSRASPKYLQPQMARSNNRPAHNSNAYRRMWNMRSHHRLIRDLEREEAIDDPERLDSVRSNYYTDSPRSRVRQPYKISARLKELAQPSLHRRCNRDPAPVPSRPLVFQPKTKPRSHHRRGRVVIDSSLGSIIGLKTNSRSALSPAKCNLTLAFMNKDTSASPRRRRSVLWR